MKGISYTLKIIEPPEDLKHKSRKEEILELKDYLYIETDAGENLSVIYVGPTEPGIDDTDKVWLKTEHSTNKPAGIYVYSGSSWELKTKTEVYASPTAPTQPVANSLWLKTSDISGSDNLPKGLYYYNNGWILFGVIKTPVVADINPPPYEALWINKNPQSFGDGDDIGATLLFSLGAYSNKDSWINAAANIYQCGIYRNINPPSEGYIRRNFQTLGGLYAYPYWTNVGLGGPHPEALYYRDANGDWISMSSVIYKKLFPDIQVPAGYGTITLTYKEDGSDYFYETPLLLTQLYNDNEAAALRWAVRPTGGFEKSKFDCLYYNAGTSSRVITILLVGLGKVKVPKVD